MQNHCSEDIGNAPVLGRSGQWNHTTMDSDKNVMFFGWPRTVKQVEMFGDDKFVVESLTDANVLSTLSKTS